MNNIINAREKFKNAIIESACAPRKELAETRVIFVDFRTKTVLKAITMKNRKRKAA